jgi:hypothetical protein
MKLNFKSLGRQAKKLASQRSTWIGAAAVAAPFVPAAVPVLTQLGEGVPLIIQGVGLVAMAFDTRPGA